MEDFWGGDAHDPIPRIELITLNLVTEENE